MVDQAALGSNVFDVALAADSKFPGAVLTGDPLMATTVLHEGAAKAAATGIWEVQPGRFTWTNQALEIFVVLQGKGIVEVSGVGTAQLQPGSVVIVPARSDAVWTVTEKIRKVWHTIVE